MNGWYRLPGFWITEGLCAQSDPDLWHPDHGQNGTAAKLVCRSCPVQIDCLTWAVENGEHHGIWGGTTANERRHLKRSSTITMDTVTAITAVVTESTCGTLYGVKVHRRNRTPVCDECRRCYNSYRRDRDETARAARKQKAAS